MPVRVGNAGTSLIASATLICSCCLGMREHHSSSIYLPTLKTNNTNGLHILGPGHADGECAARPASLPYHSIRSACLRTGRADAPPQDLLLQELEFCDVATGVPRFTVKMSTTSLSPVATVFDADGTPIASNQCKNNYGIADPVLLLFAGTNSTCRDGTEIFQIRVSYEYETGKATVLAEFQDITTKQHCELGIIGTWRMYNAYFWLKKGHSGVCEPVAKVYWPQTRKACKYQFDVAQNMDPVLICTVSRMLDGLHRAATTIVTTDSFNASHPEFAHFKDRVKVAKLPGRNVVKVHRARQIHELEPSRLQSLSPANTSSTGLTRSQLFRNW